MKIENKRMQPLFSLESHWSQLPGKPRRSSTAHQKQSESTIPSRRTLQFSIFYSSSINLSTMKKLTLLMNQLVMLISAVFFLGFYFDFFYEYFSID